jgi:hypothetical protein
VLFATVETSVANSSNKITTGQGLADVVFDAISLPETRNFAMQISNPRTGSVVFTLLPPEEMLVNGFVGNMRIVTPCAFPERQPEVVRGCLVYCMGGWKLVLLKWVMMIIVNECISWLIFLFFKNKPTKHWTIPGGIIAIPRWGS